VKKHKNIKSKMGWFGIGETDITENIEVEVKEQLEYIEIIIISAVTSAVVYLSVKTILRKCKKAMEKKIIETVPVQV
jgi:hypothetical protein